MLPKISLYIFLVIDLRSISRLLMMFSLSKLTTTVWKSFKFIYTCLDTSRASRSMTIKKHRGLIKESNYYSNILPTS